MTQSEAEHLAQLIERAKRHSMDKAEAVAQRNSFAYGNSAFENPMITRRMVEEEAAKIDD